MITDILTVMWKEWRSITRGSSRRQVVLSWLLLGMWGVLFPLQMGREWVSDPVPMGLLGFTLPVVIVGSVAPDLIAGERERHTLSTLLASPLPDRAVLFGKLGFALAVGWLSVPAVLAISLVVVNLAAPDAAPLFYDPAALVCVLALALLTGLLTGAVGTFVSLRSSTSQDAQQMTVLVLMFPILLVGMTLTAVAAANPDLRGAIGSVIESVGLNTIVLATIAILVVADALLIWFADRRFRRGRLFDV